VAGARRLANEVRVGLENAPQEAPKPVASKERSSLDDVWMGKPVRRHVREFGAIFAALFLVVCAVKMYRGQDPAVCWAWGTAGALTAMLGYCVPTALLPLWRGWMKLAHYLSLVMTFVILLVAWTIGFVPMAYLLKILRIKSIDVSFRTACPTYWESRDTKYDDFKRLELQY